MVPLSYLAVALLAPAIAASTTHAFSASAPARTTAIEDPDTGRVTFDWDLAGNLTRKVTPTLRAAGQAILYGYRFNRLERISYPSHPDDNVRYEYGGPELAGLPGNRPGRLTRVTDRSGANERFYGHFGNDSLYRLTSASGRFETHNEHGHDYELALVYDDIHNIRHKEQVHRETTPGGTIGVQHGTTYTNNYQYHAADEDGGLVASTCSPPALCWRLRPRPGRQRGRAVRAHGPGRQRSRGRGSLIRTPG